MTLSAYPMKDGRTYEAPTEIKPGDVLKNVQFLEPYFKLHPNTLNIDEEEFNNRWKATSQAARIALSRRNVDEEIVSYTLNAVAAQALVELHALLNHITQTNNVQINIIRKE